jgi:hypothetical protein
MSTPREMPIDVGGYKRMAGGVWEWRSAGFRFAYPQTGITMIEGEVCATFGMLSGGADVEYAFPLYQLDPDRRV